MVIKKAQLKDLKEIMDIYKVAKTFMNDNGNPTQWINNYPTIEIIENDIRNNNCYICVFNNQIVGVFVFIIGIEPTYQKIKGKFSSDKQYGTIHRVASNGKAKGISKACFDFCLSKCDYLRIDTHQDNKFMLLAIRKYGFKECGIINVLDGSERIAFDYLKKKEKV